MSKSKAAIITAAGRSMADSAGVVSFPASGAAGRSTGQNRRVDGGITRSV